MKGKIFNMFSRCIIICGSPQTSQFHIEETDFVIACDNGYSYALNEKIKVHLVVGDFDSYKGELPSDIDIITAPVQKDDTDTLLAVKYALDKGYSNFVLLCATGGRFDHYYANISTCAFIAEQGGFCEIVDDENIIFAIKNRSIGFVRKVGYNISVFAYTDKALGVTLQGLKYPLENATLNNLFPCGVSNEFSAETARIEVTDGILLVVMSK